MNEEVKEIMNKVKSLITYYDADHLGNTDTMYVYNKLLDYITSLEEKLETEHKAFMGAVQELTETATKIDKAVEYITSEESIETFRTIESREEWLKVNHNLLNILRESDKE